MVCLRDRQHGALARAIGRRDLTYEVTQSAVLVGLVIVVHSLPVLLIGTIADVVGEALNRKRLLTTQLFVLAP